MPFDEETFLISKKYFNEGYNYKDIVRLLERRHNKYVSLRTLERRFREEKMRRKNLVESELHEIIKAIDLELEGSGKNLGYRLMKKKIREEYDVIAKDLTVLKILRVLDPAGIERRSRYGLKRRIYTVLGPNFIWHIDGHDKLKTYGFYVHGAIDGFSKKLIWLTVATSNKNPHIIAFYYLNAIKKFKCVPTLLRSDAGTENPIVEGIHKALRQGQDDELAGERSYITGKSVHNQRIESFWAKLRGLVTGFYINFFKKMEAEDLLDTNNKLEIEVLRFCFGPLIQHDLNKAKKVWNLHRIRKQRSRGIKGGIPNVLFYLPEKFLAEDCKKPVDDKHIKIFMDKYAQRPTIYREGFKETVVELIKPDVQVPCTAEKAYNLYVELREKIQIMRASLNSV